jgi:hypothetical protein
MFHKALSRVLAEIILIIVVLAGVAGAYFVYSTYFSASAYTVDAQVDGKLVGGTLIVNIKNTGSYKIDTVSVSVCSPTDLGFGSGQGLPSNGLAPGQSAVVTFAAGNNPTQGQTYTIVLKITSNSGGDITKTITVLAM